MAGFDWNEFYTVFKLKMEKAVKCTVGRYEIPKEEQLPYVDVAITENIGGNYDLDGNEATQNPLLTITVYAMDSAADSTCESISQEAKKIMLSYGFCCRGGPIKVKNANNVNAACWAGRYQRIFGNEDVLAN